MKVAICLLPALAAGLVVAGCSGKTAADPPGGAAGAAAASAVRANSGEAAASGEIVVPSDAPGVRVAAVRAETVPDYLTVAGRIQPDPTRVVRVFPPASGRLATLAVKPGDRVQQGQTIATLQSSDVAGARADYQKARIDNERAEHAFQRAAILYENQVLAEKEYQEAKADVETSRSELARTLQRVRMLGADADGSSDRIELKAPRAGVVIDVAASPGELSRSLDNASPVCTIADLATVWAVGDVYEKDLAAFRVHAPATISAAAWPDAEWRGEVSSLSDTVDPASRTLKLRVVLPNADRRLKPEMFVSIRVLRSTSSKIVVPASAVVHEDGRTWVLVRQSGQRYRRQDVTLGRTFEQGVEIASGLTAGDVLVVEGASLLRPGAV